MREERKPRRVDVASCVIWQGNALPHSRQLATLPPALEGAGVQWRPRTVVVEEHMGRNGKNS